MDDLTIYNDRIVGTAQEQREEHRAIRLGLEWNEADTEEMAERDIEARLDFAWEEWTDAGAPLPFADLDMIGMDFYDIAFVPVLFA